MAPTARESRQPHRGGIAKNCREKGGAGTYEQAVLEQEPVQVKGGVKGAPVPRSCWRGPWIRVFEKQYAKVPLTPSLSPRRGGTIGNRLVNRRLLCCRKPRPGGTSPRGEGRGEGKFGVGLARGKGGGRISRGQLGVFIVERFG